MKKKLIAVILLLLSFISNNFGYSELWVSDPHGWAWGQGTIEEALISVRQHGIYVEYGLYLTISAKDVYVEDSTQLEITLDFDLPEEAIVNDLWLWVGDDIMKALCLDKWTASSIYEGIVNRRRDPAILVKEYGTHYKLRIYPVFKNQSRKIKLTYMVPADWHSQSISYSLPHEIISSSNEDISNLKILYWPEVDTGAPTILEYPGTVFTENPDTTNSKSYILSGINYQRNNTLTLTANSFLQNGTFISSYINEQDDGFYQMVLLPSHFIDVQSSKRVAVIIDYDISKTNLTAASIISNIQNNLLDYLSESDSFNVFFSGLSTKQLSDTWLQATEENVHTLTDYFNQNGLNNYSNLASSIGTTLEFIKQNGENSSIILVSSSEQISDYSVANDLIQDIMSEMEVVTPFHIVDMTNMNFSWHYIGNNSYRGNEYFYINLSRQTSGNYFHPWTGNSFDKNLANAFSGLKGYVKAFDLFTTLNLGFCYNRFNLSDNNIIYLDKPVMQIGRFKGQFPFEMNLSGEYDNSIFNITREFNEEDINTGDNYLQKIWTGKYIQYLESLDNSNSTIGEIIDLSIQQNLLSLYTAFLALEPNDTLQPCFDCFDESSPMGIEDEISDVPADTLINAYPNPFNAEVNIRITLQKEFDPSGVSLKIYNILGQEVYSFDPSDFLNTKILNLRWNGKNNYGQPVSSGIYLFSLTTPSDRKSLKLIMLK